MCPRSLFRLTVPCFEPRMSEANRGCTLNTLTKKGMSQMFANVSMFEKSFCAHSYLKTWSHSFGIGCFRHGHCHNSVNAPRFIPFPLREGLGLGGCWLAVHVPKISHNFPPPAKNIENGSRSSHPTFHPSSFILHPLYYVFRRRFRASAITQFFPPLTGWECSTGHPR